MGGDCRADISGGQLSTPGRITRRGATPKKKYRANCAAISGSCQGGIPRLNQVNSKYTW
ncbi:hypothetical protein EAM_2078 [Erwinia amylovora ATCC 49946]|nr:hypothetical protein EAM_2078 [Erwinia amylovora ATCC 49946]